MHTPFVEMDDRGRLDGLIVHWGVELASGLRVHGVIRSGILVH